MPAFKHDGRSFRLLIAALLCTSIVPNCLLADDKDPSNSPANAEAAEPAPTKVVAPAPVAAERESGVDLRTVPGTEQAPTASEAPTSYQEPQRRALPAPLDGVFPGSDYLGPTPLIGVPDTDPVYPLTKALWTIAPALKDARIKVYGWINPGISVSTSNRSNIPESYAIVPNRIELDQGVLRIERLPDTVQTDHVDWGFRLTPIYGIDYRWTTSQGWFSGQLLKNNFLYGFDPVEAYALFTFLTSRREWSSRPGDIFRRR